MVRMILLAVERYPRAAKWQSQCDGPAPVDPPLAECGWAYEMGSFQNADRTIRELCDGVFFSTTTPKPMTVVPVAADTRATYYFDKDGLVGLVVETGIG